MFGKKSKAAALAAVMLLSAGLLASCSKAEEEISSMVSEGGNVVSDIKSDVGGGASRVESAAGSIADGVESNLSKMASNGQVSGSASDGHITSK